MKLYGVYDKNKKLWLNGNGKWQKNEHFWKTRATAKSKLNYVFGHLFWGRLFNEEVDKAAVCGWEVVTFDVKPQERISATKMLDQINRKRLGKVDPIEIVRAKNG